MKFCSTLSLWNLTKFLIKLRHSFNNTAEAWNKGLIVYYTIFTTDKGNITYQWEITNIVSQVEVHLPRKLKEDEDKETQICQTLNAIKGLIQFT